MNDTRPHISRLLGEKEVSRGGSKRERKTARVPTGEIRRKRARVSGGEKSRIHKKPRQKKGDKNTYTN